MPTELTFPTRATRLRWRFVHLLLPTRLAAAPGIGDPRVCTAISESAVDLPSAAP